MSAPPAPAGAQRQRAPSAQPQPSQQQPRRTATTPTNSGAVGDTSHMQPITLPATVVPPAGPSSVQPAPPRQALRPPQPVIAPPMGQDEDKMYDDEKVVMGELVNEQYNQCMDSFQSMIRQLGNEFGLRLAVFCANDQECWYLTENPQAQMFADAHLKKFGKLMGVTPKNPSSSRKRKRPPEPEDYIRERDIVRKKLLDMSGGVRTLPGNSAKIEGNILKGKRATFLLQNWPLKEWINPSYLNAMQCGQILAAIESPTHPLKFRRVVPNPAAQGGLQVAPGPKHMVEDMPDDWVPVPITAQPAQPQVPGISAFIPFAQLSQFRSAMPIQLAGSQQPVSPQVPPGPPPAGPGQPQGQQSPQPQLLHAPPGPPPHAGPALNQPPLSMPAGPQGGPVPPPSNSDQPAGGAGANAGAGRGQPRRPPNNK